MSSIVKGMGRSRRFVILGVIVLVLVIAGVTTAWLVSNSPTSTIGAEGVAVANVPNLASASTTLSGRIVDGISCRKLANEKVTYHIHVHVAVYVNGTEMRLPAGIGITKPQLIEHYAKGPFVDVGLYDCLYWLHTHVADGIIHVEAPSKANFTLGQFFDVWGQPLSANQVGPAKGKVIVYENGKQLAGNPRLTPLLPHADIQLDIGQPAVAFQPFIFKVSGACGQGSLSCSTSTTLGAG